MKKQGLIIGLMASQSFGSLVQSESIEQIMKRADDMNKYKALLKHADASVPISAIDSMLKSKDTALLEQAYSEGFASIDDVTRAITFRIQYF
jgi:hypothetical protein